MLSGISIALVGIVHVIIAMPIWMLLITTAFSTIATMIYLDADLRRKIRNSYNYFPKKPAFINNLLNNPKIIRYYSYIFQKVSDVIDYVKILIEIVHDCLFWTLLFIFNFPFAILLWQILDMEEKEQNERKRLEAQYNALVENRA